MILPKPSLFDTIAILFDLEDNAYAYESDGEGHPRDDATRYFQRSLLRSLTCKHLQRDIFIRIDYRAGPGSFADNYKGVACRDCGKILSEEQTQ